ncbi:MAG: MFS transporter [Candidatus Saccharimonadales bacterium]
MFSLPKRSVLNKRLTPLYLAAFFEGFVLWYAIEKLFMRSIGFDDATIGLMAAVYATVMLITETPSGILADRWSRKGVLIIACACLAASSLICGLSNDVPTYIMGAILWGVFYALYSGIYDSVVYDVLLEENGNSDSYEKYYGRIKLINSLALVLGALAGGLMGELLGLREAFYWSIPFAILAILALVKFKEPQLHKMAVAAPLKEHVRATFKAVAQKGYLLPILIVMVIVVVLTESLFEFSQLWLIALAAPAIIYGPAFALILSSIGIAGFMAGYLQLDKLKIMIPTLLITIASVVGLILLEAVPAIITAQVILGIGLGLVSIIFTKLLHDSLPSQVRSGASSAVSTISRLVFIPSSLAFGFISKQEGVFTAAWIWLALLVVMAIFIIKTLTYKKKLAVVT